jgi:hypothetical protein
MKCVLLKMPPPPDNNQDKDKDEDDSDGESKEDELYGQWVPDNDKLDADTVIQKPRTHHKNRSGREDEPRGMEVQ